MGVVIMREMVMIIVLLFLLQQCAGVSGVGAVMKE